jgi:ABC-type transport system substrate-binding protein
MALLAALAGVSGLLPACSRTPGTTARSTTTSESLVAQPGGTVTVAVPQVPRSLNPHTAMGDTMATRMVTSLTDPQIFEIGPGLEPVLDTQFVTSAEVESVNPQTVVYDLNKSAVWSDGVPIGVQDFLYDWQLQATSLGYSDIQTITALSTGNSVQVVFKKPYADWADLFDDLIPQHVGSAIGWDDGFTTPNAEAFVSGGPYQVSSWSPGVRIVLEPNPHWWGTPAKVDKIVIEAASGAQRLEDLLSSSQAGVVYSPVVNESLLEAVSSSPDTDSQTDLGTTMLQLVFNTRSPRTRSSAGRQGVALEIDRDQIVRSLVDPLDPRVQVDDDFLATNAQHSYTSDGGGFDFSDPQAAETFLSDSGLKLDPAGGWTSGGTPVELDFRWAAGDPWSQMVAPTIEAELVQAGFSVHADPVSTKVLDTAELSGDTWDLALVPVAASPYTAAMGKDYSTAATVAGPGASTNFSGFDDPQVDALFEDAAGELAPAKAAAIYQQIDTLLWQAMPALPLFAEPSLLVSDASLSGVQSDAGEVGPMWNAAGWVRLGVSSSDSQKG